MNKDIFYHINILLKISSLLLKSLYQKNKQKTNLITNNKA